MPSARVIVEPQSRGATSPATHAFSPDWTGPWQLDAMPCRAGERSMASNCRQGHGEGETDHIDEQGQDGPRQHRASRLVAMFGAAPAAMTP